LASSSLPGEAAAVGELEAGEGGAGEGIVGVEVLDVDGVAVAKVEQEGAFPELDAFLGRCPSPKTMMLVSSLRGCRR
jgi:hypothetical protein